MLEHVFMLMIMQLHVKGANGNSNNVTYMTGLFIADTVHGSNEIIWNQDPLCDPCPVDQPLTNPILIY